MLYPSKKVSRRRGILRPLCSAKGKAALAFVLLVLALVLYAALLSQTLEAGEVARRVETMVRKAYRVRRPQLGGN